PNRTVKPVAIRCMHLLPLDQQWNRLPFSCPQSPTTSPTDKAAVVPALRRKKRLHETLEPPAVTLAAHGIILLWFFQRPDRTPYAGYVPPIPDTFRRSRRKS